MRKILSALALLLLCNTAQADRWILENSGILPLNAAPVAALDLGSRSYLVIELPPNTSPPAGAQPDFEIAPLESQNLVEVQGVSGTRPEAWHVQRLHYDQLPATADGHGVVVAVLDDGVKYQHPALASQMWLNKGEIAGNRKDDDGNGYVDDVYGYDFVERKGDPQGRISASHGTFCAGLIAATVEGPGTAQGLAPGARIMALRILGGPAEKRPTFISTAAEAIKYAADNGANIISNSWRIYASWKDYRPTPENLGLLRAAIEYAGARGVLYVAGAGNEGVDISEAGRDLPYPVGLAGLANLVGVAAADQELKPAGFSNYGLGLVQLAAPGVNIVSTESTEGWNSSSGTSYSTPIVAGALARALSAGVSPLEALKRLKETSEKSTDWTGRVDAGGVINLISFLRP